MSEDNNIITLESIRRKKENLKELKTNSKTDWKKIFMDSIAEEKMLNDSFYKMLKAIKEEEKKETEITDCHSD